MGFAGGQALVEEVVLEGGVGFSEGLSEGLRLGGLGALGAVGVEGVANDDDLDLMLPQEARNGFQVGPETTTMQRKKRLRRQAERVGDGETDAAIANIQRESAGVPH